MRKNDLRPGERIKVYGHDSTGAMWNGKKGTVSWTSGPFVHVVFDSEPFMIGEVHFLQCIRLVKKGERKMCKVTDV
jgi:hypothetical protein